MLADTDRFVSWEERIISNERGNRVIHFFLKDSWGNLVLAVEGTERSVRHMIYVVSNIFVEKYGHLSYIKAGAKWQARRDVVDWLSLLVLRDQSRSVKKEQARKMMVAEMRMLRWMCGHTLKDKIRNEEISERVGMAPIEDKMREVRLKWFRHILRRHPEASVRRCEMIDLPESLGRGLMQPIHDQTYGSSGHLPPQTSEMCPRKLKAQMSDIVWRGVGWACSKQLMHYPSFRRNGTTIPVHSFVFIMAAEGSHYFGYLEDMYEDKKRQKKVKVRWFHQLEEVLGIVSQLSTHPREVFITPNVQVISAECIDRPAAVLTPKHYEKYMADIPHYILSKVHLCFRQLKNNKIKPFTLSKLQGYSKQAVLSCMNHPLFSKKKIKGDKFNEDKQGTITLNGDMKKGHKRMRLVGGKEEDFVERDQMRLDRKRNRLRTPEASPTTKDVPSCRRLKIKLSGRVLKNGNFVESKTGLSASFKINDEIELLCQDSGIRGCWFRCQVLQVLGNRLKVQYDDVQDAAGLGNLQEWVASCKVANPDKLGQRCSGNLTARPRPPEDLVDCIFEVGAPVDVWWCDGWWEGAVITTNLFGTGHLLIYLPGEDRYVTSDKSHVRIGRDWVNGSWVNANMKPDIHLCISVNASPSISHRAMPPISELEEVKQDKQDQPSTDTHDTVLTSIANNSTLMTEDEVGNQPRKELKCHDMDADVEDDSPVVEFEFEAPTKSSNIQ